VTSIAGTTAMTIANNAVTTAKIEDGSVTDSKIMSVSASKLTGIVPVTNGGTGANNLMANHVILGNGASPVQVVAPGPSGNVLTSNGTSWVSQVPPGGGRTSCSSGFSLIGTAGSFEAFCISTHEEPAANWLDAVTNCYNKSPTRARLCSAGEWAMACVSGIPSNMVGNWEWVADLVVSDAQVMGGGACNSVDRVVSYHVSRCCFR